MAPHLSPKKTWEGAAANLVGSVLVALVFTRWLDIPTRDCGHGRAREYRRPGRRSLESAYKRSAGVKDSGTLFPGMAECSIVLTLWF